MTASPPASTPQQTNQKASDDDQEARELGIDPESYRYWKRAVAALPPMTPEEIATVGAVLRRIDARTRGTGQRGQRLHGDDSGATPHMARRGGALLCVRGAWVIVR